MIYIYFNKSGFGTFHLRGCQRVTEPVSHLFFINQLNFAITSFEAQNTTEDRTNIECNILNNKSFHYIFLIKYDLPIQTPIKQGVDHLLFYNKKRRLAPKRKIGTAIKRNKFVTFALLCTHIIHRQI